MQKKILAVVALSGMVLVFGSAWYFFSRQEASKDPRELTLEDAAKEGEREEMKLLVQIASGGEGRFERGDIVLAAPAEKEFSLAEKEGFLILDVSLTPKQAEILTLSLQGEERDESGRKEDLKRRKFRVDLEKVGISAEQRTGREITEKTFGDDILEEKDGFK